MSHWSFAVVAVLAVLCKLGDSPCGCAAHNGWYEAMCEDSAATEHGCDSHAAGEHDPRATHGCEGESCPVYVIGNSAELPPLDTETSTLATAGTSPRVLRATHRDDRVRVGPGNTTSTGQLRAALQVMLI